MSRNFPNTTGRYQRGLTLVELMVSVTLSLILLSGVLLVFSANKTTYRMQTGLSTLQENGRYAIGRITEDIKLAGYGGCLSPDVSAGSAASIQMIAVPPSSGSPSAYINDLVNGEFFTGVNDVAAAVTVGTNNIAIKQGTDSFTVFGPLEKPVARVKGVQSAVGTDPLVVDGVGFGFDNGGYFIVGDCSGAQIYRATSVAEDTSDAANPVTNIGHAASANRNGGVLAKAYGGDAVVAQFTSHRYFVGVTGRNNRSGDPVNALYRFDGAGIAEELVEGVENLQVEYAEDTDEDGVADVFRHAGAVSDWSNVLAIRLWVLVNSVDESSDVVANYASLAPTTVANPVADNRMHQEFSALVSVRNSVF